MLNGGVGNFLPTKIYLGAIFTKKRTIRAAKECVRANLYVKVVVGTIRNSLFLKIHNYFGALPQPNLCFRASGELKR